MKIEPTNCGFDDLEWTGAVFVCTVCGRILDKEWEAMARSTLLPFQVKKLDCMKRRELNENSPE